MASEDRKERFNNVIAVTIALLASFAAVCKVKDDNIVQAMQQSQADKIDDWAWYQALHVREDVVRAETLRLKAASLPEQLQEEQKELARIEAHKAEIKEKAEQDQKDYDTRNYRDDQFDLSDTFISVAVALFAVTSLVQKRWLYAFAMIPAVFGVVMGLAGLCGWHIHPDALIMLLS